jgi:hypothetical protein
MFLSSIPVKTQNQYVPHNNSFSSRSQVNISSSDPKDEIRFGQAQAWDAAALKAILASVAINPYAFAAAELGAEL